MPERNWYLPIALFLCGVWRRSAVLDSPAPSADPLISAKPTLCSRTEVIIEKLMVFKRVLSATVGRDAAVTCFFQRTVGAHETHRCDIFHIAEKSSSPSKRTLWRLVLLLEDCYYMTRSACFWQALLPSSK